MKIVIIGAGPAGATVAETLRQHDKKSEIVLLSSEPFPPYSPPALMEYFMTGEEVHFWKGKDFADRIDVEYRSGTEVKKVLPHQHAISLEDGDMISYDRLVIATGSRLYAPVPGTEREGVYNFKSLSAAKELIARVRRGDARNVLIMGAGFIGVEIALLLRELGVEVVQIEMADRVMPRMLDIETAGIVVGLMRERGIDVQLNTKADALIGEPRVEGVEMEGGKTMKADLVVTATGIKPNIDFLKDSGIETRWGVLVDDHQCTNVPEVYAAGDVAETSDRITGERYVHAIFPNAVIQARIAAQNLVGMDVPYEGADDMNSLKHLGLPIIAAGRMEGEELRMKRNSILRKLYLKDDHIVGFRLAGDLSSAGIYRVLMNKKVNVGPFKHRLLDIGFGMGYIEGLSLSGEVTL